jgi:Flp pilus assembly protein TadG
MPTVVRLLRHFDRRGTSALEFALLAPALVTIALSLYDVTAAVVAWWQLSAAAQAIDLIATNLAATPSLTNVLAAADAATASTAIYAVLPSLRTAPAQQFAVTLTSVVFAPTPSGCTSACGYTANVAWSVTLQGNAAARPCGTLAVAPDSARPSPTTLPADAFSPAPILIADVIYQFTPLLTTPFGAAFTMRESAYLSPRTGANSAWVRYSGPLAAQVQCPGYVG